MFGDTHVLLVASHICFQHHKLTKYGGATLRIVLYTLTLNLPHTFRVFNLVKLLFSSSF